MVVQWRRRAEITKSQNVDHPPLHGGWIKMKNESRKALAELQAFGQINSNAFPVGSDLRACSSFVDSAVHVGSCVSELG